MNSIFNFKTNLTTETKEFVNFNKLVVVPPSVFTTSKYFYYVTVPNDTRLDTLSVQAYNSSLYMDLIFLVNKMSSIFDLPKNDSYVKNMIDEKYKYYTDTLNIKNQVLLAQIYTNLTNKYNKENELYRNLRLVKPEYVNEVVRIIRNANSL